MGADSVVVVSYGEDWPSLFLEERARIERTLGTWVEGIEHVGSTAVPGLAAKPTLDIMVGVHSLQDANRCIRPLARLCYEYRGEAGVPGRLFFRKGNPRTHHLAFRDYLRTHPETAREYARLKYELAERFRGARAAYAEAKAGYVSKVVRRATEDKHN